MVFGPIKWKLSACCIVGFPEDASDRYFTWLLCCENTPFKIYNGVRSRLPVQIHTNKFLWYIYDELLSSYNGGLFVGAVPEHRELLTYNCTLTLHEHRSHHHDWLVSNHTPTRTQVWLKDVAISRDPVNMMQHLSWWGSKPLGTLLGTLCVAWTYLCAMSAGPAAENAQNATASIWYMIYRAGNI